MWVAVDSAEVAVMLMELVARGHAVLVAVGPVAAALVAAVPVAVVPVMASVLREHHVLHVTIKRCDAD